MTFFKSNLGLPSVGSDGEVLTVVGGEWASAAPTGGGGLIETTYDELAALLDAAEATPGTMYQFEHTPRYFTAGTEDAPAPSNITLTPDAVGDNPVTWYYWIMMSYDKGGTIYRSLISESIEVTVGDSTTELILNLTANSYGDTFDNIDIIRGATNVMADGTDFLYISGTPPSSTILPQISELPDINIFGLEVWDVTGLIETLLSTTPVGQIPATVPTSGTPETITVLCTSPSTLAPEAYSVENDYDLLQYDWNPDNWLTDSRYAIEGTIISDWTGVVYKRTGKRFDPKVYKALISQSNVELTSGTLEVGKTYYIHTYNSADDFTNVGAASNEEGVTFEATGDTPTDWTNGSTLVDVAESAPTETVLEDTTGVASVWAYVSAGYYTLTKTGIFTENKCIPVEKYGGNINNNNYNYSYYDVDTFSIASKNGEVKTDGLLDLSDISIEIYP